MVRLGYSSSFTYLMIAGMAWSGWAILKNPPAALDACLLVVFSLIVTDLISGLLHVVLDNPRSLQLAPIRGLAEGFQRHHENPARIYEMPLYQHLYVMHLPLTLLFVATLPFGNAGMHVVFLSMVVALHLMQMAHLWAHLPPERVPGVVRFLQRTRVLLSKPQHDLHHREPYDKDFCIMTGICNRPLNLVVNLIGPTTHWWLAIFMLASISPLAVAFALTLR
jgi:palmitoyl-[glycerolipid] 3-(E)-desaturase